MNSDYCLETKKKTKSKNKKNPNKQKQKQQHSNALNYFLVFDYLKSWLNLMIVLMFVLESRQVGNVQNHEPQTR